MSSKIKTLFYKTLAGYFVCCGISSQIFAVALPNAQENAFDYLSQSHIETTFIEGRQFLENVIQEINAQYKLNIRLQDACALVRKNIEQEHVTPEIRKYLTSILDSFESDNFPQAMQICSTIPIALKSKHYFYWPWEWNFFGLNKTQSLAATEFKSTKELELTLPPKLASGFLLALYRT